MFSDNENPGAELSAGQSATAATPAQESTTTTETESSVPVTAQAETAPVAAPVAVASEPAAVTVAPAEPVAAPDGTAAIEDSDVSEMVETDLEANFHRVDRGDGKIDGAVRHAAPGAGRRRGRVRTGRGHHGLGRRRESWRQDRGLDPGPGIRRTRWAVSAGGRAAGGDSAHRRPQGRHGAALVSTSAAAPGLGQDRRGLPRKRPTLPEKVVDHIKGGLVVDIGVRAFLPASQADIHPVRDLDVWKHRWYYRARAEKMELASAANVVWSRRAIMDEQVAAQRQTMLDNMAEGQV